MLTVATKLRLAAFVVIAVTVIAFTGIHYADIGRYFGVPGYYVVRVDMPDAGGIFSGADVTYRGVSVGRVGAMRLTGTGVQVDLDINNSAPRIPAAVQAVVADLSAVGEQYVDLRPTASGGPYLTTHSVVPARATQVPLPVTSLLTSIDGLATSIPQKSLRTVVNELGNAFQGQGLHLQVLLDTSSSFTLAARANVTQTSQLIEEGQTVLATQQAESRALEQFGTSARLLAGQLDQSDADLRRLIAATPQAATQLNGLLQDNTPSLSVVLANLLTVSDLTVTRVNGVEELLTALPAAVAAGSTVINSKGANFGMALTFFDPLPCTAGYGGTTYRNGLDTAPAPALNTGASCTSPASTGIDVRGSAHAPSGGGVATAARP
jgi:phospholipid/cholesterol/gamma-HCH transport system substrate-binding protein